MAEGDSLVEGQEKVAGQISDIVKASLQANILEGLKKTPEYIDELVQACLNQDVNQYGGKPEYRDRSIPYLEYLARNAIQNEARSIVLKWVEDNKSNIENMVIERFKQADIVKAFADKMLEVSTENWRIDINFVKETKDGQRDW